MDLMNSPVSMLMSSDEELVVVAPSRPLVEVWELMVEHGIQHVPVVRGDELIGLLSSWDVARFAVERGRGEMKSTRAGDVMESRLVRLHLKATLREAVETLAESGFHSLPVTDEDNVLVGILTSTDVLRYVATHRLRVG